MSAHKRKIGPEPATETTRESSAGVAQDTGSYVLEWVNCGSRYCRKCSPGGRGAHGPYWYVYRWHDGKHTKRYVGKTLPQSARCVARAGPAPEPREHPPGQPAPG